MYLFKNILGPKFTIAQILILFLMIGFFGFDLRYYFGNYDTAFFIVTILYLILALKYKWKSSFTFVIVLVLIVLMMFSFQFFGGSRLTERIGEWFFLFFFFALLQSVKELSSLQHMNTNVCSVCGNSFWNYLFTSYDRMLWIKKRSQVFKCHYCGVLTYFPRLSAKLLKDHYPAKTYYSYNDNQKGLLSKLRKYLLLHTYKPTLLSRLFTVFVKKVPAIPQYKQGGKILDVGCGSGQTLSELALLGWQGYGVEIDAKAVEYARKKGLADVYVGGYKKAVDFDNNYFDAIRMYHVIEHLEDPNDCLAILYKKLKFDGEIIIGTPNRQSIVAKIFRSHWYNLDIPRHIWLFSPSTLSKLLTDTGFEIESISFCSGGGVLGSIQYILSDVFKKKIQLIDNFFLFLMFYPLEWIFDAFGLGDVMIISARKRSSK